MNHLQPGLSGNPFYATQWSEKIDFVEPKGLGALRQAQDKLQADKAAIKKLHQFRIGN